MHEARQQVDQIDLGRLRNVNAPALERAQQLVPKELGGVGAKLDSHDLNLTRKGRMSGFCTIAPHRCGDHDRLLLAVERRRCQLEEDAGRPLSNPAKLLTW